MPALSSPFCPLPYPGLPVFPFTSFHLHTNAAHQVAGLRAARAARARAGAAAAAATAGTAGTAGTAAAASAGATAAVKAAAEVGAERPEGLPAAQEM